ncbi:MAG: tetratricopeptide repeat protein [Planctomycetia bacterium]
MGSPPPSMRQRRLPTAVAGAAILAAVAVTYCHALPAPFVMDDLPSIVTNRSIRSLWPPWGVLVYGHEEGRTVDGRPLLNLSLAVNRAVGGETPAAFRAVNLCLHAGAALLLFDVVRRLLTFSAAPTGLREQSEIVALTAGLIWAVHPLHTGAVTYIIQRAEVLGAIAILAGLDLVLAGLAGGPAWLLPGVAIVAALGGCAKETVVSLPLVTLLCDRTVVSGSWRTVAGHWRWHLAAAASWPAVLLMLTAWGGRGSSAGFGSTASPWRYLLTQADAVWTYLARIAWPATLVFDHGDRLSPGLFHSWPWFAAAAATVAGVCVGWQRRPLLFLGPLLFLVLLAPSSSVVPVKTQTVAEHRLYLPSAAVLVPVIVGAAAVAAGRRLPAAAWLAPVAAAGIMLGLRTHARNDDFLTPETLWRQSLAHDPDNERAAINVAAAAIDREGFDEAAGLLARVATTGRYRLPRLANESRLAIRTGRLPDARAACDAYLALVPDDAEMLAQRGLVRRRLGDPAAAAADVTRALEIDDRLGGAWVTRGDLLLDGGKPAEGAECLQRAIGLDASQGAGWGGLACALDTLGRTAEAGVAFDRAISLNPRDPEPHYNRANLLAAAGRPEEARAGYSRALDLRPDFRDAWHNRCVVLARLGRRAEARRDLAEFIRLGGTSSAQLRDAVGGSGPEDGGPAPAP